MRSAQTYQSSTCIARRHTSQASTSNAGPRRHSAARPPPKPNPTTVDCTCGYNRRLAVRFHPSSDLPRPRPLLLLLSMQPLAATTRASVLASRVAASTRVASLSRHLSASALAMAPVTKEADYLVLGGGSGGLGSARMASSKFGVNTVVVEAKRLGGTCVNVGCVQRPVAVSAGALLTKSQLCPQKGHVQRRGHCRDHPRRQGVRLLCRGNGALRLDNVQKQARRLRQASQWHLRTQPYQ